MSYENLVSLGQPKSYIAEAYRVLRTNIQYCGVDKAVNTMMITSTLQNEGKTTTACNLAISLAQTDKSVLLIDADLRKPKVHKYFELTNTVGLTNMLTEELDIDSIEHHVLGLSNLHIITCGPIPPNPSEMLGSKRMDDLMEFVKEKYDIVIIDTPPISQVTDAAVLSGKVDGVILVVASKKVKIAQVKYSKSILDNIGARIIGVVLSKVSGKEIKSYYNYKDYCTYFVD